MHKGILSINNYGKFKFFKINCLSIDKLDIKLFPKNIKKGFGLGGISRECDFNHDGRTISIFAFTNGTPGNENKYELPPPIDQTLYFGCLVIIAHSDNKIVTITQEMFDKFYDKSFEGFVNLGDEDTWSEEEEENSDDREFIVGDDVIEYETGGEDSTEEEEYTDTTDDVEYDATESTDETDNVEYDATESTDETDNVEYDASESTGETLLDEPQLVKQDSITIKMKIKIIE
tara:strand:- start:2382 stop:3077 length:696 start_codon:yes stop_codon:yes gene_type:complete